MDSMRSPRYTVLNSDNDNIYISKSLLNKLSQQQSQPQQSLPSEGGSSNAEAAETSESSTTMPSTVKRSSALGGSGKSTDQHFTSDAFFNENAHTMPASIDPEYIAKHAQFDSSTHLYALRGEYERKLQQYQQVWRGRFDELEGLNEQLFKLNSDKFAKEVSRVDEKYFRRTSTGGYEVPCKAAETAVINCLAVNGKKSLLCADEVRKFAECVQQTRVNVLKR